MNRTSETYEARLNTLTCNENPRRRREAEKILEEIMTEDFINLMQNINLHIHKPQQTLSKIT